MILDIRTIDDLSSIDGVEAIKGDLIGPIYADHEVPEFRDVQIKIADNHSLRDRLIKTFCNSMVLTPLSLSVGESDSDGPRFSIPTEKDGDKHVQWMPGSLRSINQAKALFNEYLAQGMIPHRIDPATGLQGSEVMRTFDPAAGEVVFVDMKVFVAG